MPYDVVEKRGAKCAVRGVEIARVGTFTAMQGQKVKFSEDDFDQTTLAYDPSFHEAKLTRDHVADGPSLGRVTKVYRREDRLLADFADVDPTVATQMIEGGEWPSRSAEFYPDLEGKGLYLRNVTILGAAPPAIKGMRRIQPDQVEFPEPARALETQVAFAEYGGPDASMYRITYVFKEADMPDNEVLALKEQALERDAKLREQDAEIVRLKEEKAQSEAAQLVMLREARLYKARAVAGERIAKLREARKLTPGMEAAGLLELLSFADTSEDTIKLGENQTEPIGKVLLRFLEAIPEVVPKETPNADPPDETPKVPAAILSMAEMHYGKDTPEFNAFVENYIKTLKKEG